MPSPSNSRLWLHHHSCRLLLVCLVSTRITRLVKLNRRRWYRIVAFVNSSLVGAGRQQQTPCGASPAPRRSAAALPFALFQSSRGKAHVCSSLNPLTWRNMSVASVNYTTRKPRTDRFGLRDQTEANPHYFPQPVSGQASQTCGRVGQLCGWKYPKCSGGVCRWKRSCIWNR
ncbi:hypothetical protein PAMP_012694 [Pampus punctatissimus]